jgi:hypothetical protein
VFSAAAIRSAQWSGVLGEPASVAAWSASVRSMALRASAQSRPISATTSSIASCTLVTWLRCWRIA